ncbi:zinc finger protein weckle-like [Eurosta solidaginis]|uniref:zinc finger protein weckle-like n=1 Tax=Eurosta solidaginis TaxID=178769 RepID=UPI0035316A64
MKEDIVVCCDQISDGKWKGWCRLCAKADAQYINVIVGQDQEEFENVNDSKCYKDLARSILELLRIHIKEDDKLPQIICRECDELLLSLIKFSERAHKVQQMYDDLQNSINKSPTNLQMLLENYGLNSYKDEVPMPQSNMEVPVEEIFVTDFVEATNSMPTEYKLNKNGHQVETPKNKDIDSDDPFNDDKKDIGCEFLYKSATSEEDVCSTDSEDSCMDISLSKLRDKAKSKSIAKNKLKSLKKCENESYKYTCSICSENFKRRSNYSLHMKRKHGLFNCRYCTDSFETELAMKQHMKAHGNLFKCLHCEQTFERKSLRSRHIKMEHSCMEKVKNKTLTTNSSRSFVCEVCGEEFPQKKLRKQHMLTKHPNYEPNVCNVCGRIFKHKSNMTKHMERHGDKFVCTECGKQLTCRAALNTHMLVHSDFAPHKCDVCGRAFKRHKALKYHLIAHTGLRPYPCDFCEKSFSTGSSCRLHKKTMHPNELAALEASGAVQYTKNVPKLADLRVVARTGTNFRALMSKQNGYAPRS